MILLFPALYVSFFVCILLFYFILKAQHCTAATARTRDRVTRRRVTSHDFKTRVRVRVKVEKTGLESESSKIGLESGLGGVVLRGSGPPGETSSRGVVLRGRLLQGSSPPEELSGGSSQGGVVLRGSYDISRVNPPGFNIYSHWVSLPTKSSDNIW